MNAITNYYENLVLERITAVNNERSLSLDYDLIQDIACLALNQLPPRYIRHSIDTAFFIPDEERAQINSDIETAIDNAIGKVTNNPR